MLERAYVPAVVARKSHYINSYAIINSALAWTRGSRGF